MFHEEYNYCDVDSAAREVDVDLDSARPYVVWGAGWKNGIPVLHPKYKGKASVICTRQGRLKTITFYNRSGERSASWSSCDDRVLADFDCPIYSPDEDSLTKEEFRNNIFQRYVADWSEASSFPTNTFPYLVKKQIKNVSDAPLLTEFSPNRRGQLYLAIPISKDGQVVGIQRIYANGEKNFIPGSKVKGAYHVIPGKGGDDSVVYICEGWATGKTINTLTEKSVYCCMSGNNITALAKDLSTKFGKVIVAADNDAWSDSGNYGLSVALEASQITGVQVRYPVFDEKKDSGKTHPTDFNDLFCLEGEKEARYQLTKAQKSILKSPRNKLDLSLAKVSFCGKRESSQTKVLEGCVSAFIEVGFSENDCIRYIQNKNKNISKDVIKHTYGVVQASHDARVARCHTINPTSHPKVNFIDLPLVKEDHGGYSIEENFYKEIANCTGIVLINSPMGSGKTERIMKPLLKGAKKAAYIAHRSALVEECCNRMDLLSYRNLRGVETSELDRVGCCVNSITNPKFGNGKWFMNADVICLDEISKVLHHITHAPVEDPEHVINALIKIINSAKLVVMCDADANDTIVRLMQNHTKQKITVAQCAPPKKNTTVNLTSLESAFKFLRINLKSRGRILCACDSKRDIEKIKLYAAKNHPNAKVLAVTSETKSNPEVAKWIKDPNRYSKDYNLVLFNSAVDSGISITTNDFELQVGLFRGVITPDSIIQMMGRNRASKSWFLGCTPMQKDCYGDKVKNKKSALKTAYAALSAEEEKKEEEDIRMTTFDEMKLSLSRAEVLSRKSYLITLKTMLEQKNYNVSHREASDEFDKIERKILKELGNEVKKAEIELVLSVKTPTKKVYEELKKSHLLTKEELAQIDRYEIYQNLCVSEINAGAVAFWKHRPRFECLFENLQTDSAKLDGHGHWEADNIASQTLHKNFHMRGIILKELFSTLEIDLETGEGSFNSENCQEFVDYLYKKKFVYIWNYLKLGCFLLAAKPPKDSTKVVKSCLNKLGLRCKLNKNEEGGTYTINERDWEYVQGYVNLRERFEQNISNIDMPERDISQLIEAEELANDGDLSDTLRKNLESVLEAEYESQDAASSSTELDAADKDNVKTADDDEDPDPDSDPDPDASEPVLEEEELAEPVGEIGNEAEIRTAKLESPTSVPTSNPENLAEKVGSESEFRAALPESKALADEESQKSKYQLVAKHIENPTETKQVESEIEDVDGRGEVDSKLKKDNSLQGVASSLSMNNEPIQTMGDNNCGDKLVLGPKNNDEARPSSRVLSQSECSWLGSKRGGSSIESFSSEHQNSSDSQQSPEREGNLLHSPPTSPTKSSILNCGTSLANEVKKPEKTKKKKSTYWRDYQMPYDENGYPVVQDEYISVFVAVRTGIKVPRYLYIKHVGEEPPNDSLS